MESDSESGPRESQNPDHARAELRVGGDRLIPRAIAVQVDLAASRSWSRGEEYLSRSGQVLTRHSGIWVISRKAIEMATAVEDLLAALEPNIDRIRAAAKEADAAITVGLWWNPAAGQGGFTMPSRLFRRLSELGERIDVYFPG